MRLPRPIYESLPVAYVVGGIAAMLPGSTSLCFSCGLLLCLSGLVIMFIRRNYRATQQFARS